MGLCAQEFRGLGGGFKSSGSSWGHELGGFGDSEISA